MINKPTDKQIAKMKEMVGKYKEINANIDTLKKSLKTLDNPRVKNHASRLLDKVEIIIRQGNMFRELPADPNVTAPEVPKEPEIAPKKVKNPQ